MAVFHHSYHLLHFTVALCIKKISPIILRFPNPNLQAQADYKSLQNIPKYTYRHVTVWMTLTVLGVLSWTVPYSGNLSRVKTFANFAVSVQFAKVLTRENFHWVRRRHDQWACHCRFPQFAKVLITNIRLSAIRESFHPRKIAAIRYDIY